MGRFSKAPIYLDSKSGLNKQQNDAINKLIKSQYNRIYSQGVQQQLPKPEKNVVVTNATELLTNYSVWEYNGTIFGFLEIDTSAMENGFYLLGDFDGILTSYTGYTDTNLSDSIMNYVAVQVSNGKLFLAVNEELKKDKKQINTIYCNIRGVKEDAVS